MNKFIGLQNLAKKVLLLLPAFAVLYMILHFSVDVPYWDEWDTPGNIYKIIIERNATLNDFFSQHNESRKLFPKLIFVLVGFTVGWRTQIFMIMSWFCVLLTSLLINRILLTNTEQNRVYKLIILLLINLLLFSPCQYENQLMGIQLIVFIPPLCITTCLWLQKLTIPFAMKILACSVLSFISTFSYANGMLCWLLGFPLFSKEIIEYKKSNNRNKTRVLLWSFVYLIFGIVSISFYFRDYIKPVEHPSFQAAFLSPVKGVMYLLTWLGGPYMENGQHFRMAATGLLIVFLAFISFCLVIINTIKKRELPILKTYWPWICLLSYGFLSGIITTLGRVGFGVQQASSSRYATFSLWALIGLTGVYYLIWCNRVKKKKEYTNVIFKIIIGLFFVLGIGSWVRGASDYKLWNIKQRQNLLTLRLSSYTLSNPLFVRLYPRNISKRTEFFYKHRFLKTERVGSWLADKIIKPDGKNAGWFRVNAKEKGFIHIAGWAMLPDKNVPPDYVLFCRESLSGNIDVITGILVAKKRKDVAKTLKNRKLLFSGFDESFKYTAVENNEKYVMFAVDEKDKRIFRLTQNNVP